MHIRTFILSLAAALMICVCKESGQTPGNQETDTVSVTEASEILPVTGTFVNLPYQDVRNKYTNPPHIDNTDPQMWATKIAEMKKMEISSDTSSRELEETPRHPRQDRYPDVG